MGRPPASITIETDDCRRTVEELKSRGVEFVSDVLDFPWGYVAQFQDPDGNRLQIREGRQLPSRSGSAPRSRDGEICFTGVEIAGEVDVRFEVLKGKQATWPVTELHDRWVPRATASDYAGALQAARSRAVTRRRCLAAAAAASLSASRTRHRRPSSGGWIPAS
jgi:Glyoxalase/Bleomycin resistance protein/Dioxygenase superfamily